MEAFTIDFEDLTLGDNSHWDGGFQEDDPEGTTKTFETDNGVFSLTKSGSLRPYGCTYSNRNVVGDFQTNWVTAKPLKGNGDSDKYGIILAQASSSSGTIPVKPSLKFNDGKAYAPMSLFITNTVDGYDDIIGNGPYNAPLMEGESFVVTITGYSDEAGEGDTSKTGSVEVTLGGHPTGGDATAVDTWTEVDLTPLGREVKKLVFEASGFDNGYGFEPPLYFAIDNIKFGQ